MPVIINDFEVISEPPSQNKENETGQPARENAENNSRLRPADIERVVRRFLERRARLRAD
jgi:hypothetical protein